MKIPLLLAAALLATPAVAKVEDSSFHDALGGRVLRQSTVVKAPPDKVWEAFTTDAGFMRWAAPWAHIVPGNGGTIEFAFRPNETAGDDANVRHRILVFLPQRLLIFQNEHLPPGPAPFDPAAFQQVRTMLEFAPRHGATLVTETVIGFGRDEKSNRLYEHLRAGNAEYLTDLAGALDAGK